LGWQDVRVGDGFGDAAVMEAAFQAIPLATAVFEIGDAHAPAYIFGNDDLQTILDGEPGAFLEHLAEHDRTFWDAVLASAEHRASRTVAIELGDRIRRFRIRARHFEADGGRPHLIVQFRTLDEVESREQELRSTISQLQDLVDNSTALMYVKDLDGRYLIVNDFFARLFGVGPSEIVGKSDHELFPESSADVYSVHDRSVLERGESLEVEEPFAAIGGATDPDDDRRWLSIKFPLLDETGRPYALGAISTDITDRKRAESAAREAMQQAERANRSKNEFLSRMSHELRTPLNAIIGFAQLLADSAVERDARESAGHILEAGRHLLGLVNDVLDITWIEAGAPGIESGPISAVEPIHQALEIIRPLAQANDLELASDLHGALHQTVIADSRRLRQVFLNLLGNAVKFNRDQGAIRVWCEVRGARLRYVVTDTGPGISDTDRVRLFVPFVRLDSAGDIEGSGLGLALSRRLVEEMGGELGIAHSAPGEGTTFFVEVALAEPGIEHPTELPPIRERIGASGAATVATILHVEDTYANLRLVESIVARMDGFRVVSCARGREGIEMARALQPDAILLDLNLADMSGVDVVNALRADPATAAIPIIVLSADATPARIAQLTAIGVAEYLTKPFDIHRFQQSVRAAVAMS
jgi:PAS domain S-box-containing protein